MSTTFNKKTIAAIKRSRTRRLANLIGRSFLLHRRKQDEKMYNLVCEEFVSLGGVYVKFLQGVLLRSEVMRRWHNPAKLNIFENLDTEPIDIQELLRNELTPDLLQNITHIQPESFAAGTFGQVYYGIHKDGTPIVVKALRPMVRELLKHDLKLLNTFYRSFFSKLYKNMDVKLGDALKDFSNSTLRETDYQYEATFANELYEAYKGHPNIVIPRTYTDLCTDNIIVQEYIDGLSVAQVVRLHEQGADPQAVVRDTNGSNLVRQLQILAYESIVGVFRLPRIQGDPHPGNIRLMSNNRVGLIDFGISAAAPEDKHGLYGIIKTYDEIFKGSQTAADLFEQSLRFFVSDLYRSLKKVSQFMNKDKDAANYIGEIGKIAGRVFEQSTGTDMVEADFSQSANVLTVVNKIINKGNRFGFVMKLEATEILRSIQTLTSLIGSLGLYKEVMPPVLDQAVKEVTRLYPEITTETKDDIQMGDAIEVITNWLGRIAERDPILFKQISDKINMGRGSSKVIKERE
jgi:serine/threonine protein kinase